MASHRSRETSDEVLHAKMKSYRFNMAKATSAILRKLEGSSSGRRPANDTDRPYREKRRYPMRDPPRGRDAETRRDQPYLHRQDREPSGGRNVRTFSDKRSSYDSYRDDLNPKRRRLDDYESLRSADREEYVSRDLSRRSWDRDLRGLDHDVGRSDVYGVSHSRLNKSRPFKDGFRAQGSRSQAPMKRSENKQSFDNRPHEAFTTDYARNRSGRFYSKSVVQWAQFDSFSNGYDIQKNRIGPRRQNTVSMQMMKECFKKPMKSYFRQMCFSSVKPLTYISALKSPIIDPDLLDLLVSTGTVAARKDFFDAVQPFDNEMNVIQHGLLKCATPLLVASEEFELQQELLTSSPQRLLAALRSAVLQCQRSIVLIGQTYTRITYHRRAKILGVLGVQDPDLKPSSFPNIQNCLLFGRQFMTKLKEWLKNQDNKFVLNTPANVVAQPDVAMEDDPEAGAESQEREAADPKFVAAIDEVLEKAKNGNQEDGEKPEFWFFFDKGSNEYKYYRQKFEEFQKSKGGIEAKSHQNQTNRRSPEELACESVRAMLYARKVQTLKRKLQRNLAFFRKKKELKLRRCAPKTAAPVKVEEGVVKEEEQQLEFTPTEIKEDFACEIEVKPRSTANKGSAEVKPQSAPDKGSAEVKPQSAPGKGSAAVKPQSTPGKGSTEVKPQSALDKGSAKVNPQSAPDKGSTEVKPQSTPGKGSTEVKPQSTPGNGSTEVKPQSTLDKGSAEVKLQSAPSKSSTEVKPQSSLDKGSTKVKPQSAPDKGSTEVKPRSTLDKGSATVNPQSSPDKTSAEVKPQSTLDKGFTEVKTQSTPDKGSIEVKPRSTPDKGSAKVKPQSAPDKGSTKVKTQSAPDKGSKSDGTDTQKDAALSKEKEPVAADASAGDVDEKTKDTAIKLAQFVAQMGPEIEQFSRENSVNNPEFWFLCDKESPAYKFYKSKVEEFKQTEDVTSDEGDIGLEDDDLENIRTGDETQNDSDLEQDAECEAAEAPRAETSSVAAVAQMPTPARPPIARKRVANRKVGTLPPKRASIVEEKKNHDPVRIKHDRPRGRGNNRRRVSSPS